MNLYACITILGMWAIGGIFIKFVQAEGGLSIIAAFIFTGIILYNEYKQKE